MGQTGQQITAVVDPLLCSNAYAGAVMSNVAPEYSVRKGLPQSKATTPSFESDRARPSCAQPDFLRPYLTKDDSCSMIALLTR